MSTGLRMLLFVSLTIALLWTVECQTPITCTAGHYNPGEKATITCHFHGEVSTDQHTGVYITRFDLDDPKDSLGKEVLMCHFSGGAVSVCKPEDGYRFVSFKNNLTIEVPDVSAEFQGRYSCGVVPANGRIAHPCFLLVEGAFAQPQDAPPKNPEEHTSLQRSFQATLTLFIIFIVVAAGAIVYAVFAYRRKWFPFGIPKLPDTSPNDEEKLLPRDNKHDVATQTLPEKRDGTLGLQSGWEASGRKGKKRSETEQDIHKDNECIKKLIVELKDSLQKDASKEEKKRIQNEHNDMIERSKIVAEMEKRRIRNEYYKMLQGLKKATTEEEKKRIQEEYDNLNKRKKDDA